MTHQDLDILIIGATGYTGRLVVAYLAAHKLASSLRVALGGRTISKVKELTFEHDNFKAIFVDLNDGGSVLAAVSKAKVVINLAGPYWPRGSIVVRACALHGVHYVDLAGEPHWQAEIIEKYDFLSYKNKACIVPCSGFDSIPSDLACFLATQTLEREVRKLNVSKRAHMASTSVFRGTGSLSGGTVATMFNHLEAVPKEKRFAGSGWSLSPIPGPQRFWNIPNILYSLPAIRPTVYGGFFPMSTVNEPLVRRSWGLREKYRREQAVNLSSTVHHVPTFSYSEFMATPGPLSGIFISLLIFMVEISLALFSPVRWIAKKFLPKPGEGPSEKALKEGWFEVVNVTHAGGLYAKSIVKGNGDPGYGLTSVECAILLLDHSNLTPVAREGGILTPTTAFGDKLAHALVATGKFEIGSELLTGQESKKTR
ncbi:hypothetical protein RhiJN_12423 [Ceratobasidium sp. AG-Ba]|nr:hypothetical protein RhiJN_12423 [Ceratobasidium sp. AG-Ba]QRW13019.1 hypothetical protein RhiLY_12018 [Ceratobasidium sp. AG-Ba]